MERLLAQGGGALSEEVDDDDLPDELDATDELDAELGEDVALDDEEPG